MKFEDIKIQFPEEDAAIVTLTGILKATTNVSERVVEAHQLECELKKMENDWLLTGVIEEVDALEK